MTDERCPKCGAERMFVADEGTVVFKCYSAFEVAFNGDFRQSESCEKAEIAHLRTENERLKAENERLRARLEQAETDNSKAWAEVHRLHGHLVRITNERDAMCGVVEAAREINNTLDNDLVTLSMRTQREQAFAWSYLWPKMQKSRYPWLN